MCDWQRKHQPRELIVSISAYFPCLCCAESLLNGLQFRAYLPRTLRQCLTLACLTSSLLSNYFAECFTLHNYFLKGTIILILRYTITGPMKMESWHETSCRRADVVVIDTMPTCMSCGSFYNRDGTDAANFGELQKGVSDFEETTASLNLDWPSTVEVSSPEEVQDHNIRHAVKVLGNVLRQRDHYDREARSSIENRSKLSATHTHGELSQVPETGKDFGEGTAEYGQDNHPVDVSAMKKSLVYGPLTGVDGIRLLHLSPRKSAHDRVLHAALETTRLSERPDYMAISYTWADPDGDRSLSEVIFLGDLWIPVPITLNCAAALRRLRSAHRIQTLWIDSICINQFSTDEKSHQVGLMRDIYSRASSVAIFLGGDEDAPDTRLLEETGDGLFYSGNQGDIIWDAVRDHVAVRALFDRPYWSRIWVIQEVLLSKKAMVILGNTTIPLQPLLKARLLEPDGSERKFSLPPWLRLGRSLPIRDFQGLLKLLTDTSKCLATDPKDMVFALLGLVQGAHLEGLVADYSKPISEIRVGIAAYFLIRHKQINVLKLAASSAHEREDERLIPVSPSWVPSWNLDAYDETNFASSAEEKFSTDVEHIKIFTSWDRKLRFYDTIRPTEAGNMPLDYSGSNTSSFRVLKGTGTLLLEAYPLLRIGSKGFLEAFENRDIANKSILLIPSESAVVRWGIYATRKRTARPLAFGSPGDWIVELPGCDEFFLLRELPTLPGIYRIASVCGLAIVVVWRVGGFADELVPSILPRYENDELISRLVIFSRSQLQLLKDLEPWKPPAGTLGPPPKRSYPATEQSSTSLSDEDMTQYKQWTEAISVSPLGAMERTTSLEHALRNVAIYLDRWQDLNLWDRMISEIEAVPWKDRLLVLAQIRRGLGFDQAPESQTTEVTCDRSWPASEALQIAIMNLDEFLYLSRSSSLLQPVIMLNDFAPLLDALEMADSSAMLKVFKANANEIERSLKRLESHLKFFKDSIPDCSVIRDKLSQRQVLKQFYVARRSELREFLIY